jgi:6-phospho-beta-glucosidase
VAKRIAIIGGGSAYAPGLIQAFISHATAFQGVELALMDIAANELEIVNRLANRMVESAGVDIRVKAYASQREAIDGADYVLTTFRQGGFEARHEDETIPLRHGLIGQETIGPGGFFFAMRTLPVIRSIARDMQELAPHAVLVNYTNPTQIVAEAVTHFTDVPLAISICDQTKDDTHKLLHALAMPDAVVEIESIGLNHATWSTRFTIDGEDGVSVMDRHFDAVIARSDVSNRVKRQFMLTRAFNRLPNSYLQYYYYRDVTVAEAIASPTTRAMEILAQLPSYYAHFEEQAAADVPRLQHVRGGSIFGDMAVEVMRGLVEGEAHIHTLNIPNQTAIPNFAPDRIVEVPARLDPMGVTPLVQERLAPDVVGLLSMLAEYQWLAAEAIWQGDRSALVRALASNPLVLSLEGAEALLNDIVPLQQQHFDACILTAKERRAR